MEELHRDQQGLFQQVTCLGDRRKRLPHGRRFLFLLARAHSRTQVMHCCGARGEAIDLQGAFRHVAARCASLPQRSVLCETYFTTARAAAREGGSLGLLSVRTLTQALPVDTAPIDRLDLLVYAMSRPIVSNSLPTRRDVVVVVDNAIAPHREFGVERHQRLRGRAVHIAVEADDRESFRVDCVQRVAEPPLNEAYLVVQQSIAREIPLHLLQRDREFGLRPKDVAPVRGVGGLIRLRQALEGVARPNYPISDPMGFEDGAHEDRSTAAPYAGLDQVTPDALFQNVAETALQIIKPLHANHRFDAASNASRSGRHPAREAARARAMARPRPVPLWPEKKGAKRRAHTSVGIPGPSSSTISSTAPARCPPRSARCIRPSLVNARLDASVFAARPTLTVEESRGPGAGLALQPRDFG